MGTRIIHCNKREEIILTSEEKTNGLDVVLVDGKGITIARYSFDAGKLNDVHSIAYRSSSVRIFFEGITPTVKCELCPS